MTSRYREPSPGGGGLQRGKTGWKGRAAFYKQGRVL